MGTGRGRREEGQHSFLAPQSSRGAPTCGSGSFLLWECYQDIKKAFEETNKLRNYIPKE